MRCEQSFLEEPRSLISAPGGEVTFTCLVLNKGGECRWQKDGKVIDDDDDDVLDDNDCNFSQWACILVNTDCQIQKETAVSPFTMLISV